MYVDGDQKTRLQMEILSDLKVALSVKGVEVGKIKSN